MKLFVGTILTTHGLKGELKIRSASDFTQQRFAVGKQLTIQHGKESYDMEIATYRHHKGNELVSFVGYQDINLVERFRGWKVYGEKDQALLEEDEYFYDDLIGCDVYNEEHVWCGKVDSLIDTGHQDILVIKKENGKESLVPYVDAFIQSVDMEQKQLIIHEIEGLIV